MSYQPRIRLFVDSALNAGAVLPLNRKKAHYLTHVMRCKLADRLYVFNGREGEWLAEVASVKKRDVELRALEQRCTQVAVPDIWLLFAPIKQGAIDFLVQKATELGVSRLIPVITDRTAVTRVNTERLRANAIEAAEQSGRLCVPEIAEPQKLSLLPKSWDTSRNILFCDETGKGEPIEIALKKRAHPHPVPRPPGEGWTILTGPEGGFSDAEIAALRALPYVTSVSLGPRILRADTAALAALACWQAVLGDWDALRS